MKPKPTSYPIPDDPIDEAFFSFGEALAFIDRSKDWLVRWGLVGLVAGAVLGYANMEAQAEIVIDNRAEIPFTGWVPLQERLRSLAETIDSLRQQQGNEMDRARWLTSRAWWTSDVTPQLALSRDELRLLANATDDVKSEGSRIASIRVRRRAASLDGAVKQAEMSVQFIREGALYLAAMDLLQGYRVELAQNAGDQKVVSELAANDVEIEFARIRLRQLEALRAEDRIPGAAAQVIVDVGQAGQATFLPLQTQLTAARLGVNQLEEKKVRLQDALNRTRLIAAFEKQGSTVMASVVPGDGTAAVNALLREGQSLRSLIDTTTNARRAQGEAELARILSALTGLRASYLVALPEMSRSSLEASRLKVVAMAAGGAVAAMVLAIVLLLLHRQYVAYRSSLTA
jgi:hypothetical protein